MRRSWRQRGQDGSRCHPQKKSPFLRFLKTSQLEKGFIDSGFTPTSFLLGSRSLEPGLILSPLLERICQSFPNLRTILAL